VQAIERAKEHGALSVAVTGTPDSPVARAADRAIVVELPQKERSPGIRTYQASLLGLLLVAIQLGEMRGKQSRPEADALRQELVALANIVDATNAAVKEACQQVEETVAAAPTLDAGQRTELRHRTLQRGQDDRGGGRFCHGPGFGRVVAR